MPVVLVVVVVFLAANSGELVGLVALPRDVAGAGFGEVVASKVLVAVNRDDGVAGFGDAERLAEAGLIGVVLFAAAVALTPVSGFFSTNGDRVAEEGDAFAVAVSELLAVDGDNLLVANDDTFDGVALAAAAGLAFTPSVEGVFGFAVTSLFAGIGVFLAAGVVDFAFAAPTATAVAAPTAATAPTTTATASILSSSFFSSSSAGGAVAAGMGSLTSIGLATISFTISTSTA